MRTRSLLALTSVGAAALFAAVVAAPSAVGGGDSISVVDSSFSPKTSKVGQGTTVTWSFQGSLNHTTTSNQGFWNSGSRSSGSFPENMPSAGRFPYHCTFHQAQGMKGTIVVPLKATGSAGSGYTLRWSTSAGGSGRAFDVQFRRQGTTAWQTFKDNTTAASAFFNRSRAGTYQLRARTINTAASPDKASGWSPVISRRIS